MNDKTTERKTVNNLLKTIALTLAIFLTGCATTSNLPPPKVMESSNEYYSARAVANCDSQGCKTFEISITNKTKETLKIDWNKSQFVSNNQALGGFWYEGIVIRDRNMLRAPEVIFASGTYNKKVAPNLSMELNLFPLAHWSIKPMPVGEAGVYLVVDVGGKEVSMKMTTQIGSSK